LTEGGVQRPGGAAIEAKRSPPGPPLGRRAERMEGEGVSGHKYKRYKT